jgi:hypothetical protein
VLLFSQIGYAPPAAAQPEFSGYYENTFQVEGGTDVPRETLIDVSKLRLDISAGGFSDEFELRGNVNFQQYHTQVSYDIAPYLPDDVVSTFLLAEVPTQFSLEPSRIWLDNAWFTWLGDRGRLRVGKQQLSWGPGYSFNPTDLFHKKTLVDPTYEKEGVTAVRYDYRWGIGGQASLIMAPGDRFDRSGYAFRLGTHVDWIGYDIAMTAHHVIDSTSINMKTFSTREQERDALGLELSGPLLGLGFWVEGNYNWMELENDFLRVIGGFDYTFENGLYVMAEGLVNMRGNYEPPYPVRDWIGNLYYGEPVGRGWVMTGLRYDLFTLLSASLYTFTGYDGSVMVNPRLTWSVAQNAEADFFAAVTTGPEDGSFPPGLVSGVARVTVYF